MKMLNTLERVFELCLLTGTRVHCRVANTGNVVLTLVLVLLGHLEGSVAAAKYAPEVGKPHPEFVLPRIDNGEPIRLSQFRGKRVLLVHFASW